MSNAERPAGRADTPARPQDERRMAGWVGRALRIEGRVVSTENLTIDGQVEGTIELGDRVLTIGPGASVKADLAAQTVIIGGEVEGNVRASAKVEIQASGSVMGDIASPRLVMMEGAIVRGTVDTAGTPRSQS